MDALSCPSILKQHVCEPEVMKKFWTGSESRYCYHTFNATTAPEASKMKRAAHEAGSTALSVARRRPGSSTQL